MKGGSITPPLLQKILEETYYEDKPLPNIDGYQLDEQLSKLSKNFKNLKLSNLSKLSKIYQPGISR